MSELLGTRRALLKGSPNRYEQDDEFRLPLAAGAVNGTDATPGPGTRVVVDTGNNMAVGTGRLRISDAVGNGDPGLWLESFARVAGRMLVGQINQDGRIWFGWDTNQIGNIIESAIRLTGVLLEAYSGGTVVTVGTIVTGTDYDLAVMLRTAGAYYFIRGGAFTHWTLVFISSTNVSTPLFPGVAAATTGNKTHSVNFLRAPYALPLPTPIYYDTFTRAPGVLGTSEALGPDGQPVSQRTWNGATWAVIAGNEVRNTPGEGAELVVNWDFSAWTGDDPDGWAISPAEDANHEVCQVGAGQAHAQCAGAGIGYANMWRNGGAGVTQIRQNILTVGQWHQLAVDMSVLTSGVLQYLDNAAASSFQFTGVGLQVVTFRPGGNGALFQTTADPGDITVNSISVKELDLADLFSSIAATAADVYIRCQVSALATGTQCGLVARLDDATTPQNFVHLHFDGSGNVVLDEMAAGVYQATIMSVAQAYTADDWVELHLTGTAFRAYHRTAAGVPTLLGAGNVTVTGLLGTFAGGFSTNDGNTITVVDAEAVGTGQEHARLNKWAKRLPQ